MNLGKILVPLTGADSDQRVLRVGLNTAKRYMTHVECLFVNRNPTDALPIAGEALTGQIATELVNAVTEANRRQCGRAKEAFLSALKEADVQESVVQPGKSKPTATFIETMGDPSERTAVAARLADMTIFPVSDFAYEIEPTLMEAQRPCLLIPATSNLQIGKKVMVAWDSGPEAARALSGALPLLEEAAEVTVVTAQNREMDTFAMDALQSYLSCHGISVRAKQVPLGRAPVGQVILSTAADLGADLLVMGAYGHSRIRELILGGATRYVIYNTQLAVMMVH
ncbi:MAG: universal stress protein [Alphaproteobacteria bacterium]|nr:universal stress protein [Alphaproteobacteria bacterium]